jgi:hypothetical protein
MTHLLHNAARRPAPALPAFGSRRARAYCPVALGAFITAALIIGWTGAMRQAMAGPSPKPSVADRLHAEALKSFRMNRFPEAYGRFVSLGDAGHAPSARAALIMCEHGSTLFGHDWDCAPHQVEAWAVAAGVAVPVIGMKSYVQPLPVVLGSGRR